MKKIYALTIAAMLAFAVMTGCTGAPQPSPSPSAAPAPTAAPSPTAASPSPSSRMLPGVTDGMTFDPGWDTAK